MGCRYKRVQTRTNWPSRAQLYERLSLQSCFESIMSSTLFATILLPAEYKLSRAQRWFACWPLLQALLQPRLARPDRLSLLSERPPPLLRIVRRHLPPTQLTGRCFSEILRPFYTQISPSCARSLRLGAKKPDNARERRKNGAKRPRNGQ